MAAYASTVIAIAQTQVGYLEKETNANLDSKTGNAGDENFTKYARDFDKKYPTFYNGKKNGYAWCDVFVDWCFVTAFGVTKALELLGQPTKSCGAGCSWSVKYYKQKGRFFKTPKVGDQIFFKDSKGEPCHTGLVKKVTATHVYTIEGNTSSAKGVVANGGAVAEKPYLRTYSKIYGYGRPNYDPEPKKTPKKYSGKLPSVKIAYTVTDKKGKKVKKYRTWLQQGDKGDNVTLWQKFLVWYGYKIDVDGIYGPKTEDATEKFQKAMKITVDGEAGKDTFAKAKTVKK